MSAPALNKSSWFAKISAVVVSSALALTMGVTSATKANAYEEKLTTVGEKVSYSTQRRVPAVESSIGVGSLSGKGGVALPGTAGYDSALVRLSVFAPTQNTTLNVAGSAALFAAAGQDASATVLTPISDGKAQITASNDANVRVEVLATFKNDAKTPGATNSVAKPVARGAAALGAEQSVGITGLGNIPSTDVRAAYVTADVNLSQAGTVTLAGQQLALPQGRTVVSTIVVPDAQQGDVKVASTAEGSIALTVRGWVSGSATNAEQANVEGSFVPAAGARWSESAASGSRSGSVNVPGASDRALSLALVSATKSTGTARTFVDVGENINGRSEGVLVDAAKGAAPQLEIVESTAAQAKVSVRGDAVNAAVLPLGDVLGTPAADKGTVDVAITAPDDGASINLADTGGITLKGTVKSTVSIDHVEVYGNGTKIGNAAVQYTADGPMWSMPVASPESQKVTYKAVAVARDDAKGDAHITTQVTLPAADATVVNPDAVVVDPNDPTNPVTGLTSNTVTFANEPSFGINKVIVSGVGNAAPQGFIRRVVAIDHTAAGWVVTTKPATLTEVFEQANIDNSHPFDGNTKLTESENTDPDTTVVSGDKQPNQLVPADQLDLSLGDQPSAQSRSLAARPQAREIGKEVGFKSSLKFEVPGEAFKEQHASDDDQELDNLMDYSKADDGAQQAKNKAKLEGGFATAVEISEKLGTKFVLKVEAHWNWFTPDVQVKEFKNSLYGEQKLSYSASIFGKVSKNFEKDLFTLEPKEPITIMAGPVPIVLTTSVEFKLKAGASGELKIEYSMSTKKSFEQGVKYEDGKWQDVNEHQNDTQKREPCKPEAQASISGSVSAEAGIEASASVKLYDIVGPQLDAGAKVENTLEASANTTDGPKIEITKDVVASIGAKIVVTIPVIDKDVLDWTLGEKEVKATFSHEEWSMDKTCPADSTIGGSSSNGGSTQPTVKHKLTGTVTNATNQQPIENATITAVSDDYDRYTAQSDAEGKFSTEIPAGKYQLTVTKNGFVNWVKDVDLSSGDQSLTVALNPPTTSTTEWRAVLTWGEKPRDEDSHLIGNTPTGVYHVYYAIKSAYDANDKRVAWLDVDDTTSYGPETLTFDVSDAGTYSYYVHNYSGEAPLNTSGAEVRLYRGDQLVKTYSIPSNWSDRNIWQVFSIKNGQVVDYVDQPAAASTMSRMAIEPKKQ
ncbi:carboxypeptidase regulatory-like domain-containing protein [Bifidobacterium simiarum]|uniref:carboxypeptidase regulatory-like domain-containing protein n=1 Tax=Bifidobacterium simiarum TaxID=2045441 RepID=UPI001BDBEA2E|nr:carboxypeptidase regulatory-like domain-containing protein [Bifidobacterium simiarum]MBT1166929.1 carboxypeptidase regulatory-like domain-containing protein [Bifidobacterium simiarum]